MRMLHAENEIVNEGALETRQAGIGGDAKIAYAILTGMVTDKVEYALREPGTNAWEANPKRSFELTLPTRFANMVVFRDFGPGLSHRFMMERYPRIGESTKDGSDNAVGGWGFGSKSPLAYLMRSDGAGAFSVISRHKGFRRIYTIGINSNGKIQAQLLAEDPMDDSDRGTGLEVSYPVRAEDVHRFREYADRIFWGFNPAPVIVDAPKDQPKIGRGKLKMRGTAGEYAWRLYEGQDLPWQGLHVRIGPVLYPVNVRMLDGLTGFLQAGDCLCIDAPIGSLSVSASRETLSYDDRTKANLSLMFQAYEASWVDGIQTKADKATSYFEACKIAKTHADSLGYARWEQLYSRISWRGIRCMTGVFNDTSTDASFRADIYDNGNFRADEFNPWQLSGLQIAVEHSPYRSYERMQGAGLFGPGKPRILWVRVPRQNLPLFRDTFGLQASDVVILDDVKLPKRVLDPKTPDGNHTKIRVRRQIDHRGSRFTGPVDLLGGGLFINSPGRSAFNQMQIGTHPDLKKISFDSLQKRMREAVSFGFIPGDMPILIRSDTEELSNDWTFVGDFLRDAVLAQLDVTQLTPRKSFTSSSFDNDLAKIAKFDLGLAPPEIIDCVHRMRAMLQVVDAEIVLNEHDLLADYLGTFCGGLSIPTLANPCAAVNQQWEAVFDRHPLLKFILSEVHIWGNKATEQDNKILEHYFKLYQGA